MAPRIILDSKKLAFIIDRLCHQIIESKSDLSNTPIIGIQPRGIFLSNRIHQRLKEITGLKHLLYGKLDITFYRDDFRTKQKPLIPEDTELNFSIEDKNVILIDDVFYTGRTIRSALDALIDFGRPREVELLVLIDRRLSRQVPIQPDYVGKRVDSIASERVKVEWKENDGEDKVWIMQDV